MKVSKPAKFIDRPINTEIVNFIRKLLKEVKKHFSVLKNYC